MWCSEEYSINIGVQYYYQKADELNSMFKMIAVIYTTAKQTNCTSSVDAEIRSKLSNCEHTYAYEITKTVLSKAGTLDGCFTRILKVTNN